MRSFRMFDIGFLVTAMAAGTFRKQVSDERSAAELLERRHGPVTGDPHFRCRIPAAALRDLTVASGSGGGYLVDSRAIDYAPALQPHSVVLKSGARVISVSGGSVLAPRGAAAASSTWLASESTQATESQPVLGTTTATPKMLSCFVEVSRQLLLQSNAGDVIRRELLASAGAALDVAALNGSGASGEPLGIIGTAGIGSVTGTSLGVAGITELQTDVATARAGHDPATCAYVGTIPVASLLKQRQKFSGTDSPLWQGPVAVGRVDEIRAFSTGGMPAGSLLYGDFSAVEIFQWDALEIAVDPFTKMQQSIIGIRLLLAVDVVVRHPAAFSLATGVT
jgi:HK97 family phage major capsid protein